MQIPLKRSALVLGAVALMSSLPAQAADDMCFEKAQNQSQMTECAVNAWKRADGELNTLYRQMQARLKDDRKASGLLVDAHRKWLAYRDAECAFQTVGTAGGSINAMNLNNCLAEVTRGRVTDFHNALACGQASGEQGASECAVPRAGR